MAAKKIIAQGLGALLLCFLGVFWVQQIPQRPPPETRKKVRFWHMWTAEWKDVVDKIAKRFNDSQDAYEVEALSVPTAGADSKFVLGVLGGDPPDVMAQWNPVIPPWADSHLIRPLDDLMTPEEKRIFDAEAYPVVKKLGMYQGKLYGMSIGVNMFGLYYLPDHLKEAGIDPVRPPKTLEELDKWGRKLEKHDKEKNLTRMGWLPSGFQNFSSIFGGGLYNWEKGEVTVDTSANRRAMNYLVSSRKRLGYDAVVRFNSGLNTASFSGGWPFIGGVYSFTYDGQWRVEQLRKYAPHLKYETAPVPPPTGGKSMAGISNGNFMVVPSGAKNPEGAWEFIKFWSGLTDPEEAAEFYTWGGWLPLTPAVARAPIYQKYLKDYPQFKTFVDLMPSENIDVLPPVAYQTFLLDQIGKAEDSAVRGTLSGDQAIESLARLIKDEEERRRRLGYGR